MNKKHNDSKHPSGLTWERWNWPFKTPEERQLVAKYFNKQRREERAKQYEGYEEALF